MHVEVRGQLHTSLLMLLLLYLVSQSVKSIFYVYVCGLISSLFKKYLLHFYYVYMYGCVSVCVAFMQVPEEARKGHWNWNTTQVYGLRWEMLEA